MLAHRRGRKPLPGRGAHALEPHQPQHGFAAERLALPPRRSSRTRGIRSAIPGNPTLRSRPERGVLRLDERQPHTWSLAKKTAGPFRFTPLGSPHPALRPRHAGAPRVPPSSGPWCDPHAPPTRSRAPPPSDRAPGNPRDRLALVEHQLDGARSELDRELTPRPTRRPLSLPSWTSYPPLEMRPQDPTGPKTRRVRLFFVGRSRDVQGGSASGIARAT